MPLAAPRFAALKSAFSNRNYAIYISCNSVSLIGFWMQRLAVSWLTWEISHSEFWVGAVAFADLVPLIFIGPMFGALADRVDRRRLAIVLQSLMMAQAFLLFGLTVAGLLSIGLLFGLVLAEGVVQAAYQPIRLALIPNLVRRQDMLTAASFNAVIFNVARFLGPALAGVVMTLAGPAWAILINGVTYGMVLLAWFFIRLPRIEAPPPNSSFLGEMRAGLDYVLHRPGLRAMFILLTLVSLFARPLTLMLSAFVGAVYEAGPETLAIFTSSLGSGAVLAGLKLSMDGRPTGLIRAILHSTLFMILALAWFAGTDDVWLGALLVFVLGYTITIGSVASQALVQNTTDDHMRGRVMSLWVAFTRGAPAIGVLLIGWLASRYGLMWPNLGAAGLCLLGLLFMAGRRREMREYFEKGRET